MKLKTVFAFVAAAGLSVVGAYKSANWIETRTAELVNSALLDQGYDWADVATDGLRVSLSGEAPDEATRFRVATVVGHIIDSDRIVDLMDVKAAQKIEPPRFSVEMLRNDDEISLIGLIPTETGRYKITRRISGLTEDGKVTEMLDTADFPVPRGWDSALSFAMAALRELPRSKISVSPEKVTVTAISDSPKDKKRIETYLEDKAPSSIELVMNITSPRPVISPFTLRFTLNEAGAKFDACSANNETTKKRILKAAGEVGYAGPPECAIGLGMPSPNWGVAVETALKGLKEMGGGSLTFSDADVTLVALDNVPQAVFDRVVGDLDATLPEVFSLHAVLPEKIVDNGAGVDKDAIEFVATLSPEGQVQLRGRLNDDKIEQIVGSYARAQFGTTNVYLATRDDENLPANWAIRVLAALEALTNLHNGAVLVRLDFVSVKGASGYSDVSDRISRILADKLGEAANFEISVNYDELLDPEANIPTPEECVDRINAILAINKIVFEPSSPSLTKETEKTVDKIADIMRDCTRVQMEIGGHTDSQGREVMNLNLSQQRADTILAALLSRRVLTRNLRAKGYGETVPIADNDTPEGRELNRRIEFRLLTDVRKPATDLSQRKLPQIGDTTENETEAPSE